MSDDYSARFDPAVTKRTQKGAAVSSQQYQSTEDQLAQLFSQVGAPPESVQNSQNAEMQRLNLLLSENELCQLADVMPPDAELAEIDAFGEVVGEALQMRAKVLPRSRERELGQGIGRFSICEELERGTDGIVYQATDPFWERDVAILVPSSEMITADNWRSKFLAKAKTHIEQQDRHFDTILEIGCDGGLLFIVLKLGSLDVWNIPDCSESQSIRPGISQKEMSRRSDMLKSVVPHFAPLVYKLCREQTLSPEEAREIGQDVFLALSQNVDKFDDERSPKLREWLTQLTIRKCSNYLAGETPRVHSQDCVTPDSIACYSLMQRSDEPDRQDEIRHLHAMALRLIRDEFDETTQKIAMEVIINGRDSKEIADELGVPLNRVYLSTSRVLKLLRECFKDLVDLPEQD